MGVLNSLLLLGCGPASFLITPVSSDRELVEHELQRDGIWAADKIAMIDVDGLIMNQREPSLFGPGGDNPVALFKEKLDKARQDSHVKAVVLRINSPGGGVTASDLMYQELRRFREDTGKPVIAAMLDLTASGGYYLACGADRIFAQPTTVTGSIGVIMMTPDLSGTMQKIGLSMNVVKSGPLKDVGSPFREMNASDRAVFQGLIDRMYARFLEVVGHSRTNLSAEQIRKLADGRVYFASEALEAGLIDEIGSLPDAIAAAQAAAGLEGKKIVVVEYSRPLGYRPNYYAAPPDAPPQINVVNVKLPPWLSSASPQFYYLWAPEW